jgi:hypothetical protein
MDLQSVVANSFAKLLKLYIKLSTSIFRTIKYQYYVSMNNELEYGTIESSSYMYYYLKHDGSLRYKSLENFLNELSVPMDLVTRIKINGIPYQLVNIDGDYTYVSL